MVEKIKIWNGVRFKESPVLFERVENEAWITIRQNSYLGDTLDCMPYGIVDKKIPGIGATSLELESPRNSIIVVPTKALADGKCGKYPNALYVGSRTTKREASTRPEIRQFVRDSFTENKKIVVVDDSLYKLLSEIGRSHYVDWFLMIDEIDVTQTDSVFRPALENAIDWYLQFPKENRCLVTATFREFSHLELQEESKTTISYPQIPISTVKLYHTDNPNAMTKKVIEMIIRCYSNEKIVIAYNSVTEAMSIIKSLKPEMQAECGMLCSESSIKNADGYYGELIDGVLPQRINFMTCAYFVGIDIEERFHLVSVSNYFHAYSLLSVNKIKQIAGRCRHEDGLCSHTIVYNTNPDVEVEYIEDYQQYLFNRADVVLEAIVSCHKLKIQSPEMEGLFDQMMAGLQGASVEKNTIITVVRRDINGVYQRAYFNIDALCEKRDLETELYSEVNSLHAQLAENGLIPKFRERKIKVNSAQFRAEKTTRDRQKAINKEIVEALLDEVIEFAEEQELSEGYFDLRLRRAKRTEREILECMKKLYRFYDLHALVSLFKELDYDKRIYVNTCNALIYKTIDGSHPFKSGMKGLFEIDKRYSPEEVKTRINSVLIQCVKHIESDSNVKKYLDIFFTYKDRRGADGYIVVTDFYSEKIKEIEPIGRFPIEVSVVKLFDFIYE